MGLKAKIETKIGIAAEYFHIVRMDVYPRERVADVTLAGYVNHQARLDGMHAIYVKTERLVFEADNSREITQADIYNFFKAKEEFEGAEDA